MRHDSADNVQGKSNKRKRLLSRSALWLYPELLMVEDPADRMDIWNESDKRLLTGRYNRKLWRMFEPCTAPPEQRVRSARKLRQSGVEVTVRLDPLVPDVTDTPENLVPLLEKLRDAGITFAAASYIFLRSGFGRSLATQLSECGSDPKDWPRHTFGDGCGGGSMIPVEERRERFEYLVQLGRSHGITIQPCRCKNPTLTNETCQIAGRDSASKENAASIDPLLPFGE